MKHCVEQEKIIQGHTGAEIKFKIFLKFYSPLGCDHHRLASIYSVNTSSNDQFQFLHTPYSQINFFTKFPEIKSYFIIKFWKISF